MKESFTWRPAFRACCLSILAVTFGVATPAYAVHDIGLFELDGNAVAEAAAGDDWATASGGGYVFGPANAVVTSGLISDPGRASGGNNVEDQSIFTQGGSKDIRDVSEWKYTTGSIPNKDDITHAYAVGYTPAANKLIIYFGADRFANNGDAQIGFWFFQDDVQLGSGGIFSNGVGGPAAQHRVGDLLILAEFTNGGAQADLKVYQWAGADGVAGHLDETGLSGTLCSVGADPTCATTNSGPVVAPWSYTPKQGSTGTFPSFSFFEGGIDVSSLFPNGVPCFASFIAETRSSHEPNAQLKDLVRGGFPVCGVSIGKACAPSTPEVPNPVFNPDTNLVHTVFNVPITNTGIGKLFDVTINEDASMFTDPVLDTAGSQCSLTKIGNDAVDPPLSLIVYGGAPTPRKVAEELAGGAVLNVTVECDSSRTQLHNIITVNASSSDGGAFNVPPATHPTSAAEECAAAPTTGVNVSKLCKTVFMIGGVVPQVCVDITVTNTSTQDLQITKLNDVESSGQLANLLTNFVSANGGSDKLEEAGDSGGKDTVTFQRCYTPTASSPDPIDPRVVSYPDQATVAGISVFSKEPTGDVQSNIASCPLCPPPQQ